MWQPAALVLAGIVTAGGGFYLVETRDHVTRDEAEQIVEAQAPFRDYRRDVEQLLEEMPALREDIAGLKADIAALRSSLRQ